MFKRVLSLFAVLVSVAALASAQGAKMTVPVPNTPANDGKQMFVSYCASCHGLDGRGGGPTAAALKSAPADLSQISKKNGGVYPETHMVAVLKFGVETDAHGSKSMPIWGPALAGVDHAQAGQQDTLSLRIANLVNYVKTLQAK